MKQDYEKKWMEEAFELSRQDKVRKICTKENPMPEKAEGYWVHEGAKETEYDGEYYTQMKCPHCKLIFTVRMSD